MKKILKIFLFLFYFVSNNFALDLNNPLPNWIDPSREKSDGKPPLINLKKPLNSVPSDFRIPAEYEPISAVVISWAGYTSMLTQIAQAVTTKAKAKIWAVAGPESISGVPKELYSSIKIPINTVWARDYGPFGMSESKLKLGIVDTIYRHYQYRRDDDAMPTNLAKIKGIEAYPADFILDGGNFMVDSKGNLFMTKRTYIWNSNKSEDEVNQALKQVFKVKNIYTFEYAGYPGEPLDGTGHIDMFMKLLNDHTVLISIADEEPFKSNSQKAIEFFKGRTAPDGEKYKIITVKGWYDKNNWYGGTWYTYTNSLIVNNVVIMPSYSGHEKENSLAEQAYKEGLPNAVIVKVNSDASITSGGSIHCITQTIPDYTLTKKSQKLQLQNTPQNNSNLYQELIEKLSQFKF